MRITTQTYNRISPTYIITIILHIQSIFISNFSSLLWKSWFHFKISFLVCVLSSNFAFLSFWASVWMTFSVAYTSNAPRISSLVQCLLRTPNRIFYELWRRCQKFEQPNIQQESKKDNYTLLLLPIHLCIMQMNTRMFFLCILFKYYIVLTLSNCLSTSMK